MKQVKFKKFNQYIAPTVILSVFIVGAICIYNNTLERLPISISILGVGFAIFQFWVRELNIQRINFYDLKYRAICDFNDDGRDLMAIIDFHMSYERFDSSKILSDIVNKGNRLIARTALNVNILFPNISNSKEYKLYNSAINDIVIHTGKLKENEPKDLSKDSLIVCEAFQKTWRKKMVTLEKQFYSVETDVYRLLYKDLTQ